MNALMIKLLPYAILGVSVFGLKHCYDSSIREDAVAAERGRVAGAYRDTLAKSIDSVQKQLIHDTITLTKKIVERKFVLDTIEKLLRDTVPIPVEVVKDIIRVDSQAFEACQI